MVISEFVDEVFLVSLQLFVVNEVRKSKALNESHNVKLSLHSVNTVLVILKFFTPGLAKILFFEAATCEPKEVVKEIVTV
jgi:hypothetical protein